MKFRVVVICVNDEGAEQRREVMEMERRELAMETLGLSLAEGKALLQGVPAAFQAQDDDRHFLLLLHFIRRARSFSRRHKSCHLAEGNQSLSRRGRAGARKIRQSVRDGRRSSPLLSSTRSAGLRNQLAGDCPDPRG